MQGWQVEQVGEYGGSLPDDFSIFAAFLFQRKETGIFYCGCRLIGKSLNQDAVFFCIGAYCFAVEVDKTD